MAVHELDGLKLTWKKPLATEATEIVAVVFTAVGGKAFCTGGKPHGNAAARLRKVMIPLTPNVRDQRLPCVAVDRAVRAPHHPDQVP